MTSIHDYENAIKECFGEEGVQALWYGGTPNKIGDDPNRMYLAIHEDYNWWNNKCVLQDWYFDYNKFRHLPLELDCESYGVYVVWMKK
jgi:hypothetical protein